MNTFEECIIAARRTLTLRAYVKQRNGVPLGGKGSLGNMLYRSLGASSFAGFWRYWNPIWGYYLGRYSYAPLRRWIPDAPALLLTFALSGAVHDLAVALLRGKWDLLFTLWFSIMASVVIVTEQLKLSSQGWPVAARMFLNLFWMGSTLTLTWHVLPALTW
ncbi:acyltransferase [Aestuariibacter halophilus]|uniref:Acyltransferase n=1 Tax=Fluctibacter halophilus TaxID=226011 RepID=A0ABS8G5V2_9ALTE|nr:MBOAT family O-acyltransferase [Aestuariibacter halophilus]MCC2615895.1 acyltransferase [Aestuariibacter halophilus]